VASGATAIVASSLLDLTQLASAANSGTVIVTGTASADTIKGTAGVDVITGGVGADSMVGSGGNDRFVITDGDSVFTNGTTAQSDSAALDKVTDFAAGDLIVISGVITDTTFSVAGNVFVGTGAGGAGDNQDNVNDFVTTTYLVDLDGDGTTFELGLDVTGSGFTLSSSYLAATVLNVTGTADADTITGGVNVDTISGGEGADVITGGAGADILTGGAGTDVFVLLESGLVSNAAVVAVLGDTIVDFEDGIDLLQINAASLASLTGYVSNASGVTGSSGAQGANFLVAGAGGQVANQAYAQFLYNSTTGELGFDADGTGAGSAIAIDLIGAGLTLTSADFSFV